MKRGSITLNILKKISELAIDSGDFMNALLKAGYGSSSYKVNRIIDENRYKRIERNKLLHKEKMLKERLSKMLYKLEKDRLIIRNNGKPKLTQKGRKKIFTLQKNLLHAQFPSFNNYKKEKTSVTTIIIFDIPEEHRKKRNWLREVLRYLDYEMAQKSVWMGKQLVPKEFIKDLYNLEINTFVEIFAITKKGTLERITKKK